MELDEAQAIAWIEKAAEGGHSIAQRQVAELGL
ncbi:hypothetical protein [Thiorhodovibrio winogradskyi]